MSNQGRPAVRGNGFALCAAVMAMCIARVALAAEFTAKERADIAGVNTQMISLCRKSVDERLAARPKVKSSALASWMTEIADSPEYCGCISEVWTREITPEVWRNGSEEDGKQTVMRAATQCIVIRLKQTFPALCTGMTSEIAERKETDAQYDAEARTFCGCLNREVDAITPATFKSFSETTMKDGAEYKKSKTLSFGDSPSLIGAMQRCGLEKLRDHAK